MMVQSRLPFLSRSSSHSVEHYCLPFTDTTHLLPPQHLHLRLVLTLCAALLFWAPACGDDFSGAPEEHYACVDPGASQSAEHPRSAEYQAFLDNVAKGNMPGAILLLRSADGNVWTGASGKADMASGVEMKACNLSRAGSVSKTFVSVLVMMLVDDGALTLDSPISHYLPQALLAGIANSRQATVRQVLNHTSGIPDYTDVKYLLRQFNDPKWVMSMEDNLDAVRGVSADFAPGEKWAYSNTNYDIAGFLIEEVAGQPFEELLSQRILEPLGLESTHIRIDGSTPAGTVRGYMDFHDDGRVFDASDYRLGHKSTAGALVSTVYDLSTFIEALFAGELVSAESLDEMQVWVKADSDTMGSDLHYGLGLIREDTDYGAAIGHNGGVMGYGAAMFHLPQTGVTAVALINGSSGRAEKAFLDDLLPELEHLLHEGDTLSR